MGLLYLAGTGSFALDVAEYARAAGRSVAGLIELIDPGRVGSRVHNLPVVATQSPDEGAETVVAVGGDRVALGQALQELGWVLSTLVHPLAAVSPSARLGPGTVVAPLAVIGAAAQIGAHGLVGRGSTIGHHATLGDGVVVNPGANIGGNTTLGERAQIGIGATVVNGLQIGSETQVAAGAVVVRNVAVGARVQGVPAREYRG